MSSKEALHAIVRQDFNGNRFVVEGRLTKSDAEERVRAFEAKEHHQYYEIIPYNPENTEKFKGFNLEYL